MDRSLWLAQSEQLLQESSQIAESHLQKARYASSMTRRLQPGLLSSKYASTCQCTPASVLTSYEPDHATDAQASVQQVSFCQVMT